MTIALTTPLEYPAIHGQPAVTYGEIKVVDVHAKINEKTIHVMVEYGNTVNDAWVPGKVEHALHVFENCPAKIGPEGPINADPKFDTLVGGSVTVLPLGSRVWDEVARSLYQHFINVGIYPGVIQ